MDEKRKSNRPPLNPPAKPLPRDPDDIIEGQSQQTEQDKNRWQRNTNAGEEKRQQEERGPDRD